MNDKFAGIDLQNKFLNLQQHLNGNEFSIYKAKVKRKHFCPYCTNCKFAASGVL